MEGFSDGLMIIPGASVSGGHNTLRHSFTNVSIYTYRIHDPHGSSGNDSASRSPKCFAGRLRRLRVRITPPARPAPAVQVPLALASTSMKAFMGGR